MKDLIIEKMREVLLHHIMSKERNWDGLNAEVKVKALDAMEQGDMKKLMKLHEENATPEKKNAAKKLIDNILKEGQKLLSKGG